MDKNLPTLVFLVSSHGFGHFIRTRHVLTALDHLRGNTRPFQTVIFCNVPEHFYSRLQADTNHLIPIKTDIGLVQSDFRTIDLDQTLERWSLFEAEQNTLQQRILDTLSTCNVRAIVSDIAPLGPVIGEILHVPSLVIANFTWSDIYHDLREVDSRFETLLKYTDTCYRKASLCYQVPPHTVLRPFNKNQIYPVPMITDRPSSMTKENFAALPGLGKLQRRKAVLLSFGGYDWGAQADFPFEKFSKDTCFITTRQKLEDHFENVLFVDLPAEDYSGLVQHADAVLSKPGYGIIADCLVGKTPLIYTERGRFAEYPVLVSWLQEHLPSVYLPGNDFLSGNWEKALQEVAELDQTFPDLPVNGADTVANHLVKYLI